MSDAARFEAFAILKGVSLAGRKKLLRAGRSRELVVGERLIEAGGEHKSMFFVLDGKLGIHLEGLEGGEPTAVLGVGESVGELSLLDGSVASANVRVMLGAKPFRS